MAEGKTKRKVRTAPAVDGNKASREEIAKALGARLAATRRGAKITQQALATKIQVVSAYVSMIELGQRLPSVEVLMDWASACGVPISEFFAGLEEEVEAGR